jgi:hypothetical protein
LSHLRQRPAIHPQGLDRAGGDAFNPLNALGRGIAATAAGVTRQGLGQKCLSLEGNQQSDLRASIIDTNRRDADAFVCPAFAGQRLADLRRDLDIGPGLAGGQALVALHQHAVRGDECLRQLGTELATVRESLAAVIALGHGAAWRPVGFGAREPVYAQVRQ